MKNRQIRKQNKQRMKDIINSLEEFNGYDLKFVQTFTLSIGHFKIKEFPDWVFGIWLTHNSDTFDIFGENVYMIDKFKPSRSTLSVTDDNTVVFENKLNIIKGRKNPDWNTYLENVELAKKTEDKKHKLNFKIYKSIKDEIDKINVYCDDAIELRIKDNNTKNYKCYPRYKIDMYCDNNVLNDDTLYNNFLLYSYNTLSSKKFFSEEFHMLDEYQFENIMLYSPEEYEYNNNRYKWNDDFSNYKKNLMI